MTIKEYLTLLEYCLKLGKSYGAARANKVADKLLKAGLATRAGKRGSRVSIASNAPWPQMETGRPLGSKNKPKKRKVKKS